MSKHGLSLLSLCATLLLQSQAVANAQSGITTDQYGGRELLVYVPARLPPPGTRALVIVLHGGLGNAQIIESGRAEHGLNMDAVAETDGFIVAYLNGTRVSPFFEPYALGWNAGGCCGLPAENHTDDVGYITRAAGYLSEKYGVDPKRIFGIGHSNGAMMTERVMCETGLYAAAVAISGPLDIETNDCAAARGKRILAIHGAQDENVPLAGGRGSKGLSRVAFHSEESAKAAFTNAGASYRLQVVDGADHMLNHINAVIRQTEGQSIAEKAAKYFGLSDT